MERDDEKNPELDEVVEESADEAGKHGTARQDVEKLEDDGEVSPKDGAAM